MVSNSPCSSRLSTVEPGVRVYTGFYGNHEVSGGEKNRQSCVLMKIDTRKVYIHTFFLPILGKKKKTPGSSGVLQTVTGLRLPSNGQTRGPILSSLACHFGRHEFNPDIHC